MEDQKVNNPPMMSRAQRIQRLNEIDTNIAKLLQHAGTAIKAMTNQNSEGGKATSSLEVKQETFKAAVSDYFSTLSFVDVNLRRQIYALEEAGIIPSEPPSKDADATETKASTVPRLGSLDVSWLNSRNDQVSEDIEAEIWSKAREFVDELDSFQAPSVTEQQHSHPQ